MNDININIHVEGAIHFPELAGLLQSVKTEPEAPAAAVPVPLEMPAPTPAPIATPSLTITPPSSAPTTAAPTFTLNDIARAGAELMTSDPSKQPLLLGLLQQFGATTVNELKPDQIGAFATAMRGLGAKI